MLRCLILFLLLVSSALAQAEDCPFVPGKSLCGLPLDAGRARFEALFGEPDGVLQLGPQRTGLLYGQGFLIIFGGDRAQEVHSWARTNLEFFAQVRNGREQHPLRLTLGEFVPWSRSRQQVDLVLQRQPPVAEDEFSEVRVFGADQLKIFYASASTDPHKLGNRAEYQVERLQLLLGAP